MQSFLIPRYEGLRPNYQPQLGIKNLIRVNNLLLIAQDHSSATPTTLIYIAMAARTDTDIRESGLAVSS